MGHAVLIMPEIRGRAVACGFTSIRSAAKPEPYGRFEHFAWQMLDGSASTSLRQKARFARLVCVVGVLLGETAMAVAEIPLPRPRPPTSTNPSLCQQQLRGFAEFKALPPITGPGECLANDVVALHSVSIPDKRHIMLWPPVTLRCPMAEAVALWLRAAQSLD
jgi:hypothetical protein